ncbi:MAG: tRNA (guanosine(37)-N1)-methyltransferase TrmD [Candidatus Jacksonbacteria bacterium RIFOXYC2_FULL_44_29]|nr:MAG: tRNA (guanine-N(1)-)-methyltransferase [Parcubacteria group bacterium GW2011_GWC2_44_22]OGY75992.1 MAG: tRNA (guanosine(37)-N1)-methyltransferase TrmD [Candidatus Jacksonbacteria bacterium RIFOXYA2_FULL_43_12]OGY76759.1 MAG: tRNA (guanosine(37)-N1)-methyltransferase TrmD [Candidatus Jacksonbacteria bacterium RIFOXYB2_FULL_44_15]OGY79165.1 MAG: tRNA (guanosine(37)-N1)-methyltransferase TrmD [Candidatus Jacksonbacteria bacterium RIFOXYC2_FULL_44_29]OGY82116.1 MAG: tRNA (guanosine(37)-N1)-
MRFDVLTIFPNILGSYLQESILFRASSSGQIEVKFWDLRDYTTDKHRSVDDTPYGGGPGMIFKIEPIYKCLIDVLGKKVVESKAQGQRQSKISKNTKVIMLSPRGSQFDQAKAEQLASMDQLILIAGRYEGIDARVENLVDEQISIGPYVLSGGELPAMVVVEAIARLLPGVLGSPESLHEESFNPGEGQTDASSRQIIEYPQYTRPEKFEAAPGISWQVPEVLLSGDHKKIEEWRRSQMK